MEVVFDDEDQDIEAEDLEYGFSLWMKEMSLEMIHNEDEEMADYELKNEVEIAHFNSVLLEAQALAVKTKRDWPSEAHAARLGQFSLVFHLFYPKSVIQSLFLFPNPSLLLALI